MRLFSQKKLIIGDSIKTLEIRPGNKKRGYQDAEDVL